MRYVGIMDVAAGMKVAKAIDVYKRQEVQSLKQSFYVYNNGELRRKDNTLQFCTYEGEKRDIPIERIRCV